MKLVNTQPWPLRVAIYNLLKEKHASKCTVILTDDNYLIISKYHRGFGYVSLIKIFDKARASTLPKNSREELDAIRTAFYEVETAEVSAVGTDYINGWCKQRLGLGKGSTSEEDQFPPVPTGHSE